MNMPSRQVHLDFHTSEIIPGIGIKFSKENFQNALVTGHINSITAFAKCHHSWCYYPTEVGIMHPNLNFDLLGSIIDAAHEIGVKVPIYITTGWSANDAENHPEWIAKKPNGEILTSNFDINAKPEDKRPIVSWKNLCLNGEYRNHIYNLTEEICSRYEIVDGLFYDICFLEKTCFCDYCQSSMKENGLNPQLFEDAEKHYAIKRIEFMNKCNAILKCSHPEASVFYNGAADQYKPEFHEYQTHFELEDLPTTWGGYDKMPPRAKYFARTGKDYLGMTGKFHTMWGEFGGFKTSAALKYECALMLAYGARCSVGDQMHPSAEMDMETYRTIGYAYSYVKEIEEFCFDCQETSELGIMLSGETSSDEGLVKILLENQFDFDIVLDSDELSRFKTIILPDCVRLDEKETIRIKSYLDAGGSMLLTGKSVLYKDKNEFAIDIGATYFGESCFDIDYAVLGDVISDGIVTSPFLFYKAAVNIEPTGGEILANIKEPYFNRTYGQYSSHQNTPNKIENSPYPAAIKKGNTIYLAHSVCSMYFTHGAQYHRDYFINALKLIYKDPVMNVKLPSAGRARLVKQQQNDRYIMHLLYASPIQRGYVSAIEDLVELRDIDVSLIIRETVKNIFLVPGNENIPFTKIGDRIEFKVPSIICHQMAIIEY